MNIKKTFLWKIARKVYMHLLPIRIQRILTREKLSQIRYLELHLADHCNLNCAYCSHFCPIAEPHFYDLTQYENDFKKLGELTGGYIKEVHLLGGEPLLNPDIVKYIEISRQYIPTGDLIIVTNGILLSKMDRSFYEACKQYNVAIRISEYPVKIDLDVDNIKRTYNIDISAYDYKFKDGEKRIFHQFLLYPENISKKHNFPVERRLCGHCPFLENGKIYLCAQIPCAKFLEKKFDGMGGVKLKFPVNKRDYIDIHKTRNLKTILKFITKSCPWCRFCDRDTVIDREWRVSNRAKSEWIAERNEVIV